MTLIRRFFSGPSLTQAILAAARHHEIDPDDLAYEVIDKKHGFLKTPRGVVIEVDPDQPLRPAAAAAPATPQPEPPDLAPPAGGQPEPERPAAEPPDAEPAAADSAVEDRLAALTEPVSPERPVFEAPAVPPQQPEWPAAESAAPTETPEAEPAPAASPFDRQGATPAVGVPEPAAPEPPPAAPAAAAPADTAAAPPEVAPPPAPEYPVEESDPPAAPAADPSPAVTVDEELRHAVAEAVDELVYLAALRVQVASVDALEDGLGVELEGPDSRRVVAHGGRALLAIQHLLPRLLFGRLGRALHCRLDCAGFHADRAARLERLARKAAERVRSGGRSWLLEPMAPDERRLVHLALADEPDVETESVGEGYLKRVRVAQV